MIAKIQIKFGKAMKEDCAGSTVEYDILSRRGSGEWKTVGSAEAHMACSYDGNWTQPDQYRIGSIGATLWMSDPALNDGDPIGSWRDMTFEVDVGGLNRRKEWRQHATVAEAKRTIKAWAAEQLSNSSLEWTGTGPRP